MGFRLSWYMNPHPCRHQLLPSMNDECRVGRAECWSTAPERSPEKAGVGGSIPSLATNLSLLESTRFRASFCLCQICAMDAVEQFVLPGLPLIAPLRIMPADGGGTIGEDVCDLLDGSALPKGFSRKRVTEPVAMSPRHASKLENSGHRSPRALNQTAHR